MQSSGVYGKTLAQFAVCRQPWNEYIQYITREDSQPFAAPLTDKPAYRGRKRGKEGWTFNQKTQLHYHMYPDERIFANLSRWREGDTIGDVAIQQFRSTQPFDIAFKDPAGDNAVDRETYMKLNYKNPATLSKYLTRTGAFYPQSIRPMAPDAFIKLRSAKSIARQIGLYPRFGNPFWHRSQQFRPRANKDTYDPLSGSTKDVMEQFAHTWLQTNRVKQYFQNLQPAVRSSRHRQDGSPDDGRDNLRVNDLDYRAADDTPFSSKNPTVPGLMSVSGLKKKMHNMYSGSTKKRMGFPNPVFGIRKM